MLFCSSETQSTRPLDADWEHRRRHVVMKPWHSGWALLFIFLLCVEGGHCESPSPSVHWGAISYPDQHSSRSLGVTINRFTEFDNDRSRYNPIDQTVGFNFAFLSWTEHWRSLPGWSANVTLGGGPTSDQPSRFLQNDVMHKPFGFDSVPVGRIRNATDFMFDASITRWATLFDTPNVAFVGVGASLGSVYHEPFVRVGARRVVLSEHLRFSAMGRYGRPFGSSAFDDVATQSLLGQASLAVGSYRADNSPAIEVEIALTYDKGLFNTFDGRAKEQYFLSVAFRGGPLTLELWNDSWHPAHFGTRDFGPTYGLLIQFDVLRL